MTGEGGLGKRGGGRVEWKRVGGERGVPPSPPLHPCLRVCHVNYGDPTVPFTDCSGLKQIYPPPPPLPTPGLFFGPNTGTSDYRYLYFSVFLAKLVSTAFLYMPPLISVFSTFLVEKHDPLCCFPHDLLNKQREKITIFDGNA